MSFPTGKRLSLTALEQALAKLGQDPSRMDFSQVAEHVKRAMVDSARESIQQSRSPDRKPYAPLKRRRGKPLVKSGRMLASLGAVAVVTPGRVRAQQYAGSPVGAFHQKGTRTIPARPFLGVGRDLADRVAALALDEAVRKLGV